MKHYFVCSLFHSGLLGGGLIVDEKTITYKTGKVIVDSKYKNAELEISLPVCKSKPLFLKALARLNSAI